MRILYLTTIAVLSCFTFQKVAIDRIGVKGPLEFNKTDYFLGASQRPNVNYYIQHYFPREESIKNYNQLLTVSVLITNTSLQTVVAQKTAELNLRKETDKYSNYSLTSIEGGKELIVDCVMTTEYSGELKTAEFVIYRYRQIEVGDRKAVLIYSYSKRSYGREVLPFFGSLAAERKNLMTKFQNEALPVISIKE